jgi:alpha-tubulin suppressor-like RCC1 family protein
MAINGGSYAAGPLPSIVSGNTISIEQTSSSSLSTTSTAVVTVGTTTSGTWDVTTTGPVSMVSQGGEDACAITLHGTLYCWGLNSKGEDGIGSTTAETTAQQVGTATNWALVSMGAVDACGIAGGALYCWGKNAYGQDGIGNTTQEKTPQLVGTLTTWSTVSQSYSDTCGIAGGAAYCWGENNDGEDGLHRLQRTIFIEVNCAYSKRRRRLRDIGRGALLLGV